MVSVHIFAAGIWSRRLGAINGGGKSFTYNEANSDPLSETDTGSYCVIGRYNTATFYEFMFGTETYAPGGSDQRRLRLVHLDPGGPRRRHHLRGRQCGQIR
jgi:hypothetical protein